MHSQGEHMVVLPPSEKIAVIYAGFFDRRGAQYVWGSVFRGSEQNFTIGEALKFGTLFPKICFKLFQL